MAKEIPPTDKQLAPVQTIFHTMEDQSVLPGNIVSPISPVSPVSPVSLISPVSPVESVLATEPVPLVECGTSTEVPFLNQSPKLSSRSLARAASMGSESVYSVASNDDSPSYPD